MLGKADWKVTLVVNEYCPETSDFGQNPAFCGVFSLSAFQFSAFHLYPNSPFPSQPLFPRPPVFSTYFAEAARVKKASTGMPVQPTAVSGALRKK